MPRRRPTFGVSFFRALGDAIEQRGLWALFPLWLILAFGLGGAAAWFLPDRFWSNSSLDVATTVYTGLLAFDGLLLALGWGAFSKIYEILSTGWFVSFLRRNGLLAEHLLFVDIAHNVLVLSALASGIGLLAALMEIPVWTNQIIFGCAVGTSVYALKRALSAMSMMNDLVWELAHCEPDNRGYLQPVEDAESK